MDGTLADFRRAFHDIELRLFGPASQLADEQPEVEEASQAAAESTAPAAEPRPVIDAAAFGELRRRRRLVWREIQGTPDFWRTLRPTEAGAVARILGLAKAHRWEVFFITQRPSSEGETVQRQTQHWLIEQGFDLPSVLVLGGSRGAAAAALRLDYLVDDSPQNCADAIADSSARPILLVPHGDDVVAASARHLGIATVGGIGEALDILEKASLDRANPRLLDRLAAIVGWK